MKLCRPAYFVRTTQIDRHRKSKRYYRNRHTRIKGMKERYEKDRKKLIPDLQKKNRDRKRKRVKDRKRVKLNPIFKIETVIDIRRETKSSTNSLFLKERKKTQRKTKRERGI